MQALFPHLISFSKNQNISLEQIKTINQNNILDQFHLPLSMIAFQQCMEVTEKLNLTGISDDKDMWSLRSGGNFLVRKVYSGLSTFIQDPSHSCGSGNHVFS